MADIKDLLQLTENTYKRLKDSSGGQDYQLKNLNLEFIQYNKDAKSDYGGLCYFDHSNNELIIASRGTKTSKDIVTDLKAVGFRDLAVKETLADIAAKRFADKVLDKADRSGNKIKIVTSTGHSLGGRLSETILAQQHENNRNSKTSSNLEILNQSITFNGFGVYSTTKRENEEYKHVNLQVKGSLGGFSDDLVSHLKTHLGHNISINTNSNNFYSAHKISTLSRAMNNHKEIGGMQASDFIQAAKNKSDINQIVLIEPQERSQDNEKEKVQNENIDNTIMNKELILPFVGKHQGTIIIDQPGKVFQELDKSKKYIMVHDKANLDKIPQVGDHVSIDHKANGKSKVEKINSNLQKGRGR